MSSSGEDVLESDNKLVSIILLYKKVVHNNRPLTAVMCHFLNVIGNFAHLIFIRMLEVGR